MSKVNLSNNNIKALFDLADSLRNAIRLANADGKVNLQDIPVFIGVLFTLLPAIQAVRGVAKELVDLDEAEVAELKTRLSQWSNDPAVVNLVGYLLLALGAGFDIKKK